MREEIIRPFDHAIAWSTFLPILAATALTRSRSSRDKLCADSFTVVSVGSFLEGGLRGLTARPCLVVLCRSGRARRRAGRP